MGKSQSNKPSNRGFKVAAGKGPETERELQIAFMSGEQGGARADIGASTRGGRLGRSGKQGKP